MREILFKAKRKDNGEWIQGYYYQIWQQGYICWGMINNMPDMVEVNPNTLCQYTGLTDKNGKRIWENDIISINAYSYYEPEDDYFGVVTYCEKDACWSLYSEASDIICECFGSYTTEIINHGNIFDNPELLEVE